MSSLSFDVKTYVVSQNAGPQGDPSLRATMNLELDGSATHVQANAILRFYVDGTPLQQNVAQDVVNRPVFYASYPYCQYAGVIDLLRNEKPVKFFFDQESGTAYVGTYSEKVGEGE